MQKTEAGEIDSISTEAQKDYADAQAPKDTPPPPPPSTLAFLKLAETDRKKLFSVANKSQSRVRKLIAALTIEGKLTMAATPEGEKLLLLDDEVAGRGLTIGDAFAEATKDIPGADLYKLAGPTLMAMLVADKVIGPFVADNRKNRRALGLPGKVAYQKMVEKANKAIEDAKIEAAIIDDNAGGMVSPAPDVEVVVAPTGGAEA